MSAQPPTQPAETSSAVDEPLSVAQAAQLVGVSEQALRKRIRKGTLPARKLRRGNQIVTVVAREALDEAYPEVAGLELPQEPSESPQPVAQPQRSERLLPDEAIQRLREDLATARAAREAAEGRCEAAEERALRAEEKLERALVQRGDELARTRKEAERQAMQMAMEIARAQIQAQLPAATEDGARPRWWLGVASALAATAVAGVLGVWGWQAWSRLDDARVEGRELAGQVAALEGRTADAFARVAAAEEARRLAQEEAARTTSAVAAERADWRERERSLVDELEATREAGRADRERLLRRVAQERALRQVARLGGVWRWLWAW